MNSTPFELISKVAVYHLTRRLKKKEGSIKALPVNVRQKMCIHCGSFPSLTEIKSRKNIAI